MREKRRAVRRSRYQNPAAFPDARPPPFASARRNAIIRRPVVDRLIIVQPANDRQAIIDKAIKEDEEIAKTIRAGRNPDPAVRLISPATIIHNREALDHQRSRRNYAADPRQKEINRSTSFYRTARRMSRIIPCPPYWLRPLLATPNLFDRASFKIHSFGHVYCLLSPPYWLRLSFCLLSPPFL